MHHDQALTAWLLRQCLSSPLRVEWARAADIIFVPLYAHALSMLANELKKPNKCALVVGKGQSASSECPTCIWAQV